MYDGRGGRCGGGEASNRLRIGGSAINYKSGEPTPPKNKSKWVRKGFPPKVVGAEGTDDL